MHRARWVGVAVALAAVGCTDGAGTDSGSDAANTMLEASRVSMDVATGHPDKVSGGDALVVVTGDAEGLRFRLGDVDVTDAFAESDEGPLAGNTVGFVEG